MKKAIVVFSIYNVCFAVAFAQLKSGQIQVSKVPVLSSHFLPEYTFDVSSEPARWSNLQPGLNVSFASTDELFLRSEVPQLPRKAIAWKETGWKGERLNAQILVWSGDTLRQVRLKVNDLVNARGGILPKKNIQLNIVRYVLSNYPYAAKNVSCEVSLNDTAFLMPDRFETFERFDLPGRTVRPVWLSVNIPAGTQAGMYTGSIDVSAENHHSALALQIGVQNQVLPDPHNWKFRLDLWQNPWVVAAYYQLKPWSPEHKALLQKHLKLYAEAGGKYITTYTVHSPWSDNSYTIEETMIGWNKRQDGSWSFDYDIFDQYVTLVMETGIDQAITIYTPVPWGHRFRHLDEKTGNYIEKEWSPRSEEFKTFWNIFLTDLKGHLEKKGWFEKTYLGINESPLEFTIAAARVIKDHSKKWKITYAGDWHPELANLLDDYSPIINREPALKEIKERSARGFTTTYYVCCTPPTPNNFVFSPPVEGRYQGWYAAASGYDGFLRWAYDAWPHDPMRDARHTLWPAGDCSLVYPGGNSCIRYEKLREGIVDFEKISILSGLAAKSSGEKIKNLTREFEAHLRSFSGGPDDNKRDYDVQKMTESIQKGRKMMEELSRVLAHP